MSSPSGYVSTHALYMHTLSCATGTHWAYRLQSLLQSPSRCPHRCLRVSSTHSQNQKILMQQIVAISMLHIPNLSHRSCRRGSIDLARAIENRFAVLNLSGSTDFARRVSRSSWEFSTSSRVKRVLTSLIYVSFCFTDSTPSLESSRRTEDSWLLLEELVQFVDPTM